MINEWNYNPFYPSNYYLAKAKTSSGTSYGSIVNQPPGIVYPKV